LNEVKKKGRQLAKRIGAFGGEAKKGKTSKKELQIKFRPKSCYLMEVLQLSENRALNDDPRKAEHNRRKGFEARRENAPSGRDQFSGYSTQRQFQKGGGGGLQGGRNSQPAEGRGKVAQAQTVSKFRISDWKHQCHLDEVRT